MNKYVENSKTLAIITKFYEAVESEPHSKDMIFFLQNWELNLAKAILYEFGDASASSVAKAILAVVKNPIDWSTIGCGLVIKNPTCNYCSATVYAF